MKKILSLYIFEYFCLDKKRESDVEGPQAKKHVKCSSFFCLLNPKNGKYSRVKKVEMSVLQSEHFIAHSLLQL